MSVASFMRPRYVRRLVIVYGSNSTRCVRRCVSSVKARSTQECHVHGMDEMTAGEGCCGRWGREWG